ncbi:MAG: hypothetical protein IPM39_15135 [Chloroflexi bacterium]|nr:hypothetical protein [Chloroflexota bacterium]
MKTAVVAIAEKPYTIREPKRKANAKWRQRFQAEFSDVAALIEGLPRTEMTPEALGGLLHQIIGKVGGSVDILAELVFDYSPELAADRETIEEEAYDSEIMAAFTAVLKLAYPFGSVLETMNGLVALGQKAKPTLPSSS